jgi:hypothetical protein
LYCNYEKQGNKYIIKEIYKAPTITINDLLKTKNSKYIKLLADIMLEQLYKNPEELQQIPLIRLFTMLGVTNDNYKSANVYRKELSQLYNIQLASIYYFYSNTRNEFKRIIERCLNNLQKRSVLFWNKCVMIVDSKDKDNKLIYKADEETKKMILDTQKEVLQHMEISNMTELMKDKKRLKEFNKIIEKELSFNYYFAYEITVGEKAIKIEYENIQKERKEFNKLIINKTNKMFNKDFFLPFQSDYDTLINVLIDTDYKCNIQQLLIDKKEENFNNYIADNMKATKEYSMELVKIKDKYIDTYSYDDILE